MRKGDPEKEAGGCREARVPANPCASGRERLLEVMRSPLRGSAPPSEEPDRGGAGLRPEPAERAGGVAVRPRGPDRREPSGARPAGSAARTEELALLLDGGRRGGGRDRPEPGRDMPAAGRRPARLPRGRAPAGLGPLVEPRRRARTEAVEGPVRRRPAEVGPRNRSRMPRLRSAGRRLNPAKSGQRATSQFNRLRFRTVRSRFLAPLEARDIPDPDALNRRFRAWVEAECHMAPHRGLDGQRAPLDQWAPASTRSRRE